MVRGVQTEQGTATKNYLIGEISDLEEMKKLIGQISKEDMQVAVENFVLSVFAAADKDERTCPEVTKNQAISFKRAGDFIMVLTLFQSNGTLTEEWQKRQKYCVYKAGTIMKSLKAGEVPVRGNPFEPEEEKQNSTLPEPTHEQPN